MTKREDRRIVVQAELDAAKDQAERNRMGQFATPTELAVQILEYAKEQLNETEAVRFIDPAIGTGSFYSALLKVFPADRLTHAVGYEVDLHYGEPAARLWKGTMLDVHLEDFTRAAPPSDKEKFNLLVCNPPYVRHHHIASEEKRRLKAITRETCGIKVNGLAGLYCYFLGLSHQWMAEGGLAGWLIPSEFMDVNYGASMKHYLLDKVTLLHIHRFDPKEVQFGDALVSSAVVWFSKKEPHRPSQSAYDLWRFTAAPESGTTSPESIRSDATRKWTLYPMKESHAESHAPVLADFFTIKRGLATGGNRYFILSPEEIAERGASCRGVPTYTPKPASRARQRNPSGSRWQPCIGTSVVPPRLSVARREDQGAASDARSLP